MARISPAAPEQFAQVADTMERWKSTKGYPPNSWLTMVRKPRVFRAYRELHTAVMMDEGEVPGSLKFLVACVVSMAAGDAYCAAHNAENAAHIGKVPTGKVEALARFRESPLFTPAERAALAALTDLELRDTFRLFAQPEKIFSWWDYRAGAFRRNQGLRIDLMLASATLSQTCLSARIDKEPRGWERPSDHVPVVAEFALP